MERVLTSPEALTEEAATLAASLEPRGLGATLITLSGELGAGKTTFTQGFAKALGVEDAVTSPTFVLEKIYALPKGRGFERLIHIDAYRLESGADLAPLGFAEAARDTKSIIILEWPEMVAGALPEADVAIRLEVVPEGRKLIYG